MIDTIEQVSCKVCGKPLTQKSGKGHRPRIFCNKACKQVDYRRRHPTISNVALESDRNVTIEREYQVQRIAELEREVETLKALRRKASRDKLSILTHHSLQDRFMAVGEKDGYPPLSAQIYVEAGVKAYRSVAKDAPDNVLAALIIAAESKQS